jgi:hypothetical protein
MDLSQEDSLRLNVLVKTSLAIRIDENQLVIFGLADSKERRIDLKPSGNAGQYLRLIREHLSNLVLGTPGGYPVFIQRWTRSGALGAERLSKLLCLGETEAVVAVAASPNITDTLAGRAWWCLPTAEVARLMLRRSQVIKGRTGPPLAKFLLDYLPFEIESTIIIQTVQILLVSELIDQSEKARLWARGQKNAAYLIGFLSAGPEYMIQTDSQNSSKQRIWPNRPRLLPSTLNAPSHKQGNNILRVARARCEPQPIWTLSSKRWKRCIDFSCQLQTPHNSLGHLICCVLPLASVLIGPPLNLMMKNSPLSLIAILNPISKR